MNSEGRKIMKIIFRFVFPIFYSKIASKFLNKRMSHETIALRTSESFLFYTQKKKRWFTRTDIINFSDVHRWTFFRLQPSPINSRSLREIILFWYFRIRFHAGKVLENYRKSVNILARYSTSRYLCSVPGFHFCLLGVDVNRNNQKNERARTSFFHPRRRIIINYVCCPNERCSHSRVSEE